MKVISAEALLKAVRDDPSINGLCFKKLKQHIAELPDVKKQGRCNWCDGYYHTKIMASAIRYHSNGNMDGYEMKVNYCPNCGARMDGETC